MLLSIIIPIYNIENYIKKCFDSIIKIRNIEYEILAILGKSTDNSNNIVEEYALKYPNIKIYFQNKKGLSNARNYGLINANGKYVFFCDGDDFIIHKKFEEAIFNLLESDADFLVSEYIGIYDVTGEKFFSSQMIKLQPEYSLDKNLYYFLKKKKCFWNVWRYIYRRDFLIYNNIFFVENSYSEDLEYTTRIFLNTKNIYFYKDAYYYYRKNRLNSLMNLVKYERVEDTLNVIEESLFRIYDSMYSYKDLFYKQYIFEFILNMATIYEVERNNKNKLVKLFNNKLNLLVWDKYIVSNLIYLLIKIMGIKFFSFILFNIKKFKNKSHKK